MAAEDAPGDIIRYTTKELLAEIRDGISIIKATLASHDIRLISLERYVDRNEKISASYYAKVDILADEVKIQDAVNAALEARRDKGFSRREKMVGALTGVALLILNVLTLGPDLIHSWGP